MKKLFFIAAALLGLAGCVSIYDNVNVHSPGQVDIYGRNVLDKCPPHILPSRLVKAEIGMGVTILQGGTTVDNQQVFDQFWNSITPTLDTDNVSSYSLKPIVDWDHQSVFFMPIYVGSSRVDLQACKLEYSIVSPK